MLAPLPPRFAETRADRDAFHILVARLNGENVAAGMAFDHGDDGGIINIGTLEPARRRGLGTTLTALLLHDALDRGCATASLQSTAMAEHVYATWASATWAGSSSTRLSASRGNCMVRLPHRHYPHGHGPSLA